ncbi:cytochrome c3 family protein [Thiocystis violascens]|uniref:Nitrate/TMAO reductase, membrane-bound tetraheme cytochrome c subunit n=1 Tax=Thiocystis violascens (strain ATCC 17096 / DSM 198 / 6111) TaxID=765911 RepID=I3Y8I7_THIV6|nr:NapC/NirT family cytochrome c [Thiocystis violascens]AFL73305.1 nitrate/TMAO reductase, membrane-bound tetraheme cytochrome c subunit [Thiocystis violascens DSM 198]
MSSFGAPLFITRHVLIALVVGGLGGVLLMAFLIEFDHFTSSSEFCTSCHSMTYAEDSYRQTAHYDSASGVRATCGDCHVSEGLLAATWDHAIGIKDLIKQFLGPDYDDPVINTLHLPEAAFAARAWFRKRDSATCSRCHTQEAILGKRADTAAIHREETEGKSCIDCHYNLVHRKVPDERTFKREAWNRMVEDEFGLEPGMAAKLMMGSKEAIGSLPALSERSP